LFEGVLRIGCENLPGDDFGLEVSFLDFAAGAEAASTSEAAAATGTAAVTSGVDSLGAAGEAEGFALPPFILWVDERKKNKRRKGGGVF